ncbi:MAG TPA: hypothetical protein VF784_12265 [Anaerolineales bacterium]
MRHLALVTVLSLLAGMAAGLAYAWVVSPLRYVDTTPNTLRADFKDQFRSVIAASYAATHNLDRAKARLALLGDADPVEALTAQAQRMLAAGQPFQVVQDVAGLASDLRAGVASLPPSSTATTTSIVPASSIVPSSPTPTPAATAGAVPSTTGQVTPSIEATATPAEATPTAPPSETLTPRPTRTPMPTASAPFQLVSEDQVCSANLTDGLMQVSILDRHHHQMPGVEIDISWAGGEESFFTGFKPEIGDGYADYIMQAGVTYALNVGRAGTPVSALSAPSCPDANGQTFLGGLKLVFQQP